MARKRAGSSPPELAGVLKHPSVTSREEFAQMMRAVAHYMVHRADPGDLAAAFIRCIVDAAAWRRSVEVLAGWSVADRLGQIKAPTLVLVGRYDVLASPPQAYRIARRVPDTEVVVFHQSGHALFYRWRALVVG